MSKNLDISADARSSLVPDIVPLPTAQPHVGRPLCLISIKDAVHRTSISRAQIYRMIEVGDFPRPIPVTGARKALLEHEVDEWIVGRIAAARPAA